MLAGVVELVLRLTIAEEKIELSVPISSSVCLCVCVCVSTCTVFMARFSHVCERFHVFTSVHVFTCVARSAAENDAAVAQ